MYSNNLCPLIDKPSRITTETATLIDHIFTDRFEEKVVGGLITWDVSDHLPVFAIFPAARQKILTISKRSLVTKTGAMFSQKVMQMVNELDRY